MCLFCRSFSPSPHPPSLVTIFGGVSSFHPSQRWVGGACALFLNCSASDSLLRVSYSPLNIPLKCSASFKLWKTSLPAIRGEHQRKLFRSRLPSVSLILSPAAICLPFFLFSQSVGATPCSKRGLHQTVKRFYPVLFFLVCSIVNTIILEKQINVCVVL